MSDYGVDPDRIDDEQALKDIALLKGITVSELKREIKCAKTFTVKSRYDACRQCDKPDRI